MVIRNLSNFYTVQSVTASIFIKKPANVKCEVKRVVLGQVLAVESFFVGYAHARMPKFTNHIHPHPDTSTQQIQTHPGHIRAVVQTHPR